MKALISVLCILYGLVSLFAPEPIWRLGERMRYKDQREPSKAGLALVRVEGVAIIALALLLLTQTGG